MYASTTYTSNDKNLSNISGCYIPTSTTKHLLINARRACTRGIAYGTHFVCVCVCLSVCLSRVYSLYFKFIVKCIFTMLNVGRLNTGNNCPPQIFALNIYALVTTYHISTVSLQILTNMTVTLI